MNVDIIRAHCVVKRPIAELFAVLDDSYGRVQWDKSYLADKSKVLDDWKDEELNRIVYYHDVQGSMVGGLISARDLVNIRCSRFISDTEALLVRTRRSRALLR